MSLNPESLLLHLVSSLQGLHCMQPPSRVVRNSCHVFSHTTDRVPWCNLTIQKRHYSCFSLGQAILLACLVVSLLSSVQPNQANKGVDFQLAINSYLSNLRTLGPSTWSAAMLLLYFSIMAGRSAWMRVIWSELSKDDIKYNCMSIFDINWTLCLHHGSSEVEGYSVA